MTRAPLRLLLWTCLALAPLAARAGTLPPPLGADKNPCFDTSKVASSLSLDDANDPNAVYFSHLPDCPTLCKKAGLSCAKFAKRAAACAKGYADDRARFAVNANCARLVLPADRKQCSTDAQTARTAERQTADDALAAELTACDSRVTECTGKCDAAP